MPRCAPNALERGARTPSRHHRAPWAQRQQGSRPELHPRSPATGADRRHSGHLDGEHVYEVGPGPGGLTRALLEPARRSSRSNATAAAFPRWKNSQRLRGAAAVIEADALKIDERDVVGEGAHVVANLPYNVGTALLLKWLSGDWPPWWKSLTLMFQKRSQNASSLSPAAMPTGDCRLPPNGAPGRHRDDRQSLRLRPATQSDVGGGPRRADANNQRASTPQSWSG